MHLSERGDRTVGMTDRKVTASEVREARRLLAEPKRDVDSIDRRVLELEHEQRALRARLDRLEQRLDARH